MNDPKPPSASNDDPQTRTVRVEAMTRVEGEGGLDIRFKSGQLETVQLRIFEPPRFFEAMLRGRPLEDAPDITARICGICPVAYQMSAVHALERALDISVPEEIRSLRRLLYCGEWIESHVLHVNLLHLPDFLGYPGSLEMAKDHPEKVTRALRLRKAGNSLLELLGGRAIHPINVCVGGFYRVPRPSEMQALIPEFQQCLELAIETTLEAASLSFPNFDQPYNTVSLIHPTEYPMCEGKLFANDGWSCDPAEFEQHFVEQQVPHSTALQAIRTTTGKPYLVGPLARLNHCREQLKPMAKKIADEIGWESPWTNPYKSLVARCLEVVHAFEESLEILKNYIRPLSPRVAYEPRESWGAAITEAPRGLLFHSYAIDSEGRLTSANIVPPTSQNQGQIEDDLRTLIPALASAPDDLLAQRCEQLVRAYDPCISCSTHFLKVKVHRNP